MSSLDFEVLSLRRAITASSFRVLAPFLVKERSSRPERFRSAPRICNWPSSAPHRRVEWAIADLLDPFPSLVSCCVSQRGGNMRTFQQGMAIKSCSSAMDQICQGSWTEAAQHFSEVAHVGLRNCPANSLDAWSTNRVAGEVSVDIFDPIMIFARYCSPDPFVAQGSCRLRRVEAEAPRRLSARGCQRGGGARGANLPTRLLSLS